MIAPSGRRVPFGTGDLALPEGWFELDSPALPARPRTAASPGVLEAAIDRPIGGPTMEEALRGAERVLVAVSDGTRRTEIATLLPGLLERIRRAGGASVTFAVGGGIHRPPTPEEIAAILGPGIASRHRVIVHDPDDPAQLTELGRTSGGTPVIVHRALLDHDRVVLTGAVGFHYYAGFSGGRKAVVPGLASRLTVSRNHLRALRADGTRHPSAVAGRLDGNPVHRDMVEGAALVRPAFLVNTIPAEGTGVESVFAGDWRRAHLAACRHLRATRRVSLTPRDLVVASAGGEPTDLNLIQSHKAFEAGFAALSSGGTFVLVARCRDGAGSPDFLPFFAHPDEASMVEELRRDFKVYRQTALAWHRKARRCRLVLVSGLDEGTARALGAEPAADLDAAFRLAAQRLPRGTRGWLLSHGSQYLVEPAR